MYSLRIYMRILIRVAIIVAVAGGGVAGIVTGKAIILGSLALLLALGLIASLVSFLNASNRRVQLFLDAIQDNESMLYFPENSGSEEQRRLHAAFNRIHELMKENKRKEFDRVLHRKEYEAWEKLMHVLTHEIMNAIAPVVSLSGTLLSYYRTPDKPKSSDEITEAIVRKTIRGLDTIQRQGQSLMHLTDSYRRLSGLQQPVPALFSLSRLLQNLQLLHQADLEQQQICLSLELFQSEIMARADEKMLSQVLINLLKNAMQALKGQPNGSICIRVSYSEALVIEVADNGPGVPPDLLPDIFVPFFTTKATGSGIGLSLSRQIIRMHGGELLLASSQPYVETCFRIILPLAFRDNHA